MSKNIINLKEGSTTESIALLGKSLWYSSQKHENLESFREIAEKKDGAFLDYHGIVDYAGIKKIVLNEDSKNIYLKYTSRKKAKVKEIDFTFSLKSEAHQIAHFIGDQTDLTKREGVENKITRLGLNLFWLAFSLGATLFLASFDEAPEVSGSRTSRGARSLFKMVHDAIGQTGILVVGALVTIFLIYKTIKRYRNPSHEIVYS